MVLGALNVKGFAPSRREVGVSGGRENEPQLVRKTGETWPLALGDIESWLGSGSPDSAGVCGIDGLIGKCTDFLYSAEAFKMLALIFGIHELRLREGTRSYRVSCT